MYQSFKSRCQWLPRVESKCRMRDNFRAAARTRRGKARSKARASCTQLVVGCLERWDLCAVRRRIAATRRYGRLRCSRVQVGRWSWLEPAIAPEIISLRRSAAVARSTPRLTSCIFQWSVDTPPVESAESSRHMPVANRVVPVQADQVPRRSYTPRPSYNPPAFVSPMSLLLIRQSAVLFWTRARRADGTPPKSFDFE